MSDTSDSNCIAEDEIRKIKSQYGLAGLCSLLDDATVSLAMIVNSCGDANGFIADNISDAIASINLLLITLKQSPAQVICTVSKDKEFIQSQIEILKAFVNQQ